VLLLQAPPTTHAERPRRRRRFRTAAFAALATLIVGALAGWTIVRVLPPEVTDRWIAPLVNGRAAESTAPPVQSPPSPSSPELDAPDLPFAGISPPPALSGEVVNGNTVSQNRQEAGPDAAREPRTPGSTRPGASTPGVVLRKDSAAGQPALGRSVTAAIGQPAPSQTASVTAHESAAPAAPASQLTALPALPLRPDAGVQDGGVDAGSVRPPAGAGRTESATAPGADNPVTPDTRGSQLAPLTIVAPLAASPPATQASAPPRSDPSAPPGASESTGQPPSDERAPTTGIGPPPDLRATTAAEELEADQRAITRTIGAYAQGYTSLNASAVRHVWPGVNEDALRNAFEQIESQAVAFSGCHVDVRGLHASATCRGTATYVPKVGGRDPVTASREWRFSLRKVVNMWVIETVDISE
jgi:hypothetical protein